MAAVQFQNISKSFGDFQALTSVDLNIGQGEFFSVLGPSGCGKTTLLRVLAGLETPTSGKVVIDGADVTTLPPQKRNVGIVFQNYALFPHMTVFENVAYGLEVMRLPGAEIRQKVRGILEKVRLAEKSDTPVPMLSGGEQQRVAVARAVVVEPRVLLFDEPLSNLDYSLRLDTRTEIKRLQREVGITTLYVTHDQGEALALSDRIAVLHRGIVRQVGTPEELYMRPRDVFTASFIGHANLFSDKSCREYFGLKSLREGEWLAVLPEEVALVRRGGRAWGTVADREFSGLSIEYTVILAGQRVRARRPAGKADREFKVGDLVGLRIDIPFQRKVRNE